MLREIPDCERGDNDDYARWFFEAARAEWEAEQRLEDEYLAALANERAIIPLDPHDIAPVTGIASVDAT